MTTQKQNWISWIPIVMAILVYLVSMGVTWGSFTARGAAQEEKIKSAETRIDLLEDNIVDMKIKIERIDANVSFIKSRID